jgi:hypothetical protein
MTRRTWTRRILLAFVLVTIGFALGRQTAPQGGSPAADPELREVARGSRQVVVYSAHMTFRCWECNQIEILTRQLLDEEFAAEQASGLIAFRSVDYMQDAEFARRYDIAASTVVVARFAGGRELGHQRLDEVWTKSRDPQEFLRYVKGAIESQLEDLRREAAG